MPFQLMLQLLQVLRSSRQQLDNCSITTTHKQYTAYFNLILEIFRPIHLHRFLVLSSLSFVLINHFRSTFNLPSLHRLTIILSSFILFHIPVILSPSLLEQPLMTQRKISYVLHILKMSRGALKGLIYI